MNTYPDDPLTPEERELAQLAGRLGPHGEPSLALDSRILAAAHAAVANKPARKPKPRWPVAMGLAASVVFAVGIAWQLRPVQQTAIVSEAPVAYSRIEPVAPATATSDAMPAAMQAEAAAAEAVAADTVRNMASAPAPEAAAEPRPAAMPVRKPAAIPRQQPRPLARAKAPDSPPVPHDAFEDRYNARAAAPPAPAPPAPPAPAISAAAGISESAFATEPAPAFVPDVEADASTGMQGFARETRAAMAKQSAARNEAKAMAAREMESRTLDRVEVTGSRLKRTDLQVPVSEDAQLAVEEWLERVRTRYGLGDAGAAKQSLLLFVKDHPGEPVPGDLEPLLEK